MKEINLNEVQQKNDQLSSEQKSMFGDGGIKCFKLSREMSYGVLYIIRKAGYTLTAGSPAKKWDC